MDYVCYKCSKEFVNLDVAIQHLKDTHSIRDKTCKIKCLVNYDGRDGCNREYLSFKTMKSHAALCVKQMRLLQNNVVITHNTINT